MKCQFIKLNNTECRANHIRGSNFCFRHDPANNEAKLIASTKGGQNRALQGIYGEEIKLKSPTDIRKFIGTVINGVWTGQVPVPVGTSMGFLAKCWLESHSASEIQLRLEAEAKEQLEAKNPQNNPLYTKEQTDFINDGFAKVMSEAVRMPGPDDSRYNRG